MESPIERRAFFAVSASLLQREHESRSIPADTGERHVGANYGSFQFSLGLPSGPDEVSNDDDRNNQDGNVR